MAGMEEARVAAILLGPQSEGPMHRATEVRAVAGRGLEGDRYFRGSDDPSDDADPAREITLIEEEGLAEAATESGLDIRPEDTRRNIVTRGVRLDDLLGETFWVGEVQVEALRANPPCSHLAQLSGKPLLKPLIKRGGVRGRIVSGGVIRVGDAIRRG